MVRSKTDGVSAEMGGAPTGAKAGGVQSLVRAFGLLDCIAQHEQGITLTDLTKHVALHSSTTFSLVQTLVNIGCVVQNARTKRYHIGAKLFALASRAFSDSLLVELANPILDDLSYRCGETALLAILSSFDVIIAARSSAPNLLQVSVRQGGIWPAHCTAVGKALLAFSSKEQFENLLGGAKVSESTNYTVSEPEKLRAEVENIRRTKVAYDDGEFQKDVRCIAVPVSDFSGRVVASIGVSAPTHRMSLDRLSEVTYLVRHAAGELALALGGQKSLLESTVSYKESASLQR